MKQRKCPQAKAKMCFDYGDCESCVWNKLISKYERKIKRLMAENDILKINADDAFQQGLDEKRELIALEIRKETAKELLQILYDEAMQYGKTTVGIEHMAQKYGVKVGE